ncbi:MAG: DUF3179 domain-containing protein [Gammaproteobacteria bacterium]|nr:DUF3179 domain-containing protein [Gammaproteobacteria bacterium]
MNSQLFVPVGNRFLSGFIAIAVSVLAILSSSALAQSTTVQPSLAEHVEERFGTPPLVPEGELSDELAKAVEEVFINSLKHSTWGRDQTIALNQIAESKDPRLAWPISDLMRFVSQSALSLDLAEAVSSLLNIEFENGNYWGDTTDHLMAWNIPAPPNYLVTKRRIFTTMVPGWENLFEPGEIDWRHVSWGGVLIDNRAFDNTDQACNCIPAADNPVVTSAADAKWLDDDDTVFGVEVNGEYRAYPRQIMEVREMVNDTLGGRDLGIPYCTLCGSAQAYFTDDIPEGFERPVLRTSGLLIRSNKVMYDLETNSIFDTFTGKAVTGPMAKQNIQLKQASVVTTDWGTWKTAYPNTTVLAEELALGRDFDFRNGRDANGPIFPIGDVDPRLPVHEDVIGAVTATGQAIAFPRGKAYLALKAGDKIEHENIRLELSGGGIRAVDSEGNDLGSHQAFWFAWSQFYPQTLLWPL